MAPEDKQRAVVEEALAANLEPWERQADETSHAFDAFGIYRDLPPSSRSVAKVGTSLGKHRRTLEDWSTRNGWVRRARAWDDHCDAERREAQLEKRRKMGERHAQQAATFQRILMEPAIALAKKLKDEGFTKTFRDDIAKLKPAEILQMAKTCASVYPALMRAERLASGESTENVEGRIAIHTVRAVASRIAALAAKYVPPEKLDKFLADMKTTLANELGE